MDRLSIWEKRTNKLQQIKAFRRTYTTNDVRQHVGIAMQQAKRYQKVTSKGTTPIFLPLVFNLGE